MCTESDKGQPARWKEGPSDINSFLNLCSFVCGESVSNKELKVTKGKQQVGRKVSQTSTLFVLSRSFPLCCSLLARPNSKWLFLQKIVAKYLSTVSYNMKYLFALLLPFADIC